MTLTQISGARFLHSFLLSGIISQIFVTYLSFHLSLKFGKTVVLSLGINPECLQAEIWGICGTRFICFISLRDLSPTLPVFHLLKIGIYTFCLFLSFFIARKLVPYQLLHH